MTNLIYLNELRMLNDFLFLIDKVCVGYGLTFQHVYIVKWWTHQSNWLTIAASIYNFFVLGTFKILYNGFWSLRDSGIIGYILLQTKCKTQTNQRSSLLSTVVTVLCCEALEVILAVWLPCCTCLASIAPSFKPSSGSRNTALYFLRSAV